MPKIPALLLGVALIAVSSLSAQTYDALHDFALTANPNGVWSYGTLSATTGGAFTPFAATISDSNYIGQRAWYNAGSYPNEAAVQANVSGATVTYTTVVAPADMLNLDGESAIVSVRWTAPADGVYAVSGQFQRNDTQTNDGAVAVEVSVVQNAGAALFDMTGLTANGATAPFSLPTVSLHAGDTLDFVETPNVPHNDTTGLSATITYSGPLAATTISIAATSPQAVAKTGQQGAFTLTRTGDVSQTIKVPYVIKGSAQNGVDYAALSGQKKMKAGKSSVTIFVTPIYHDGEAAKSTVKLQLKQTAGYALGASTAKVKIESGSNIIILP